MSAPTSSEPALVATSAVVLAAGEGTRMRSERPKPLHRLCGRPMVLHVLHALAGLPLTRTVVVIGHGGDRVAKAVGEQLPPGLEVDFVEQRVQRGTGDAVSVAMTALADEDLDDGGDVLVVPGDTPLVRSETLAGLLDAHRRSGAAATLLTARLDDPSGYGRVLRDRNGRVARVVEQADADETEAAVDEVNTSVYVLRRSLVAPALRRLRPDNAQGEYYLTDIVAVLHDAGYPVGALQVADPGEVAGVNDRVQLAAAEAELRRRVNRAWLARGVTLVDPEHTYLDVTVELAPDACVYPGTLLQGTTVVAAGAEIGPNCHLVDCNVGPRAVVTATVGRTAEVGADAVVGPWAYLPPGCRVAPGRVTGPGFAGSVGVDVAEDDLTAGSAEHT